MEREKKELNIRNNIDFFTFASLGNVLKYFNIYAAQICDTSMI
jgi:hypothetical protein